MYTFTGFPITSQNTKRIRRVSPRESFPCGKTELARRRQCTFSSFFFFFLNCFLTKSPNPNPQIQDTKSYLQKHPPKNEAAPRIVFYHRFIIVFKLRVSTSCNIWGGASKNVSYNFPPPPPPFCSGSRSVSRMLGDFWGIPESKKFV